MRDAWRCSHFVENGAGWDAWQFCGVHRRLIVELLGTMMIDGIPRDVVGEFLVLSGGVIVGILRSMYSLALVDEVPEVHPVFAIKGILKALLGVRIANW